MKKIWLLFSLPLSMLYGAMVAIRNSFYLNGIFKRVSFGIPIISVGNLNAGGSGKTPMVILLLAHLSPVSEVAVLSRGYGRKSKGFRWVELDDTAELSGDEPLMIKSKFPKAFVAVCESRVSGVRQMLKDAPQIKIILLDDAFQHLPIQPSLNILLTDHSKPYFMDYPFPAGLLREFRSGNRRADIIVVTKCPEFPDSFVKTKWKQSLHLKPHQQLFFAKYVNGEFKPVQGNLNPQLSTVLVTGIANADPLKDFVSTKLELSQHFCFKDHFSYHRETFEQIARNHPGEINVITTEKDWIKWGPFLNQIQQWNIMIVPVQVTISQHQEFNELLTQLTRNKMNYGQGKT